MLRKSRIVAVLSVCVMMFAVAQPALAWDWEGGFWGGVGGAILGGAAVILTGGAALPLVVGGAAAGSFMGGADEETKKEVVDSVVEIGTAVIVNEIISDQYSLDE